MQSSTPEDAVQEELRRFTGTWKAVSSVLDGKALPQEEVDQIEMTVDGDHYTLRAGDFAMEGTHTLNPAKRPKEQDVVRTRGPEQGKTVLAIYELTDDAYTICIDELASPNRPTEFVSRPGTGHRLQTYKRVKDAGA